MSTFSLSPWTRHGSTLAGKLHDDFLRCSVCGVIDHCCVADLARAPSLVADHCGTAMELVSLAELDEARERAAKQRGASL